MRNKRRKMEEDVWGIVFKYTVHTCEKKDYCFFGCNRLQYSIKERIQMQKISWGILSTANIGVEKVIPAMQKGKHSEITAIASRDFDKAQKVAHRLGIR